MIRKGNTPKYVWDCDPVPINLYVVSINGQVIVSGWWNKTESFPRIPHRDKQSVKVNKPVDPSTGEARGVINEYGLSYLFLSKSHLNWISSISWILFWCFLYGKRNKTLILILVSRISNVCHEYLFQNCNCIIEIFVILVRDFVGSIHLASCVRKRRMV